MDDDPMKVADRAIKINTVFVRSNTACAMEDGWRAALGTRPAPIVRHLPQGTHRPDMIARVVGPDQGSTPPDLSSRSLLQRKREREREPGIRFLALYTSLRAIKRQSFRGVANFLISAYLLIVYVTSMNILYCKSTYNRFQVRTSVKQSNTGSANQRLRGQSPQSTIAHYTHTSDLEVRKCVNLSNTGSANRRSWGQSPLSRITYNTHNQVT